MRSLVVFLLLAISLPLGHARAKDKKAEVEESTAITADQRAELLELEARKLQFQVRILQTVGPLQSALETLAAEQSKLIEKWAPTGMTASPDLKTWVKKPEPHQPVGATAKPTEIDKKIQEAVDKQRAEEDERQKVKK